ncbi:MAG: EAL domain-containing protein, partial [Candidatus Dadabacteria bacterium]|nr:EAL domain-containing protein [Candidatus Dadabacteria bacterium]
MFKQAIIPNISNDNDGEYYEILIRMQKNDELILPNIFLPAAEQYGLASKIDEWVITKVFDWL